MDSDRIKEVDHLTIHTPPSYHVASFHSKDTYCYYHPCIDDPKKHYGFKLVLSTDITNKIACRKFLFKNEEEICTMHGDDVGIQPDDLVSLAMLYFIRRSLKDLRMFSLDDSWRTIWLVIACFFSVIEQTRGLLVFFPLCRFLRELLLNMGTCFTTYSVETGVTGKRRRRDLSSDDIRDLEMASRRGRLKEDLASSM
ncbi:hypothetical protein Tco_0487994 [Tanacetum coccineum]